MDGMHYSDDELLDRMYGIRERADNHLDQCQECRGRWSALGKSRAAELNRLGTEPGEEILLKQRAAIFEKIEHRSRGQWLPGPIPAFATAAVCLVASFLYQPAPRPVEISDAQFFAEIYSVAESNEPRAAAPIQNLFQGEQQR